VRKLDVEHGKAQSMRRNGTAAALITPMTASERIDSGAIMSGNILEK
jgi:hypothetical protein